MRLKHLHFSEKKVSGFLKKLDSLYQKKEIMET